MTKIWGNSPKTSTVTINPAPRVPETFLSRLWETQRFAVEGLRTLDGQRVEILRRGQPNLANGPDFHAARLRIDGQLREGDVELHLHLHDWYAHGHHHDPSYNRTILHVVFWPPRIPTRGVVAKANGDELATVIVSDRLTSAPVEIEQDFARREARRERRRQHCQQALQRIPPPQLAANLQVLGQTRLYGRAFRFEGWLTGATFAAFEQVLYEAICEGLGYALNQAPFLALARRLPLTQIFNQLPDSDEAPATLRRGLQAMIFGVAGLLPTPATTFDADTAAYLTELRARWEMLRARLYVTPLQPEAWHFFRLRPANFPTRRLAALSELLLQYRVQSPLAHYVGLFELIAQHPAQLPQSLRLLEQTFRLRSTGYWQGRANFGRPGALVHDHDFIGRARGRDLLISAVLPALLLYALHTSDVTLEQTILRAFQDLSAPPWNRPAHKMVDQFFRGRALAPGQMRTASVYQGLLHLYKHYCAQVACQICPFEPSHAIEKETLTP